MIISGMIKSSLIDYPGKIAIVLFTPGCNFNCFYCHNRSLIEDISTLIDPNEVQDFLIKRQGLIDAVVISGGEPTLHPDLPAFLEKMKAMGYLTKLDSNGSNPEVIQSLLERNLVDYYAIDYKMPASRYQEICGIHALSETVLKTIQLLTDANANFEVRTTVIPQLSLEDLVQMAQEIPRVPRYVLNPYRKPIDYLPIHQSLVDVPPYSEKEIREFAETLMLYQENVVLPF